MLFFVSYFSSSFFLLLSSWWFPSIMAQELGLRPYVLTNHHLIDVTGLDTF